MAVNRASGKKTRVVTLTQSIAGHVTDPKTGQVRSEYSAHAGQDIELDADIAERYIERGFAVPKKDE